MLRKVGSAVFAATAIVSAGIVISGSGRASEEALPSPAASTSGEVSIAWEQLGDESYMTSVASSDAPAARLIASGGECTLTREQPDAAFVGPCTHFDQAPERVVVFEGGSAHFLMPRSRGKGTLYVRLDRRTRPSGETALRLFAERRRCSTHEVPGGASGECELIWTATRFVPADALTVDAELETARAETMLRRKLLVVRWAAMSDPEFAVGPLEGYSLLQQRDAVTGGRWGALRWKMPESYDLNRDAGVTLYRRFEI